MKLHDAIEADDLVRHPHLVKAATTLIATAYVIRELLDTPDTSLVAFVQVINEASKSLGVLTSGASVLTLAAVIKEAEKEHGVHAGDNGPKDPE